MADKIFLLMGIQGSGKGTQADRLSRSLNIPHVSTGDIFREVIKQESALGEELRRILNAGELVPDELTSRMVQERISKADAQNGFILDGYPRTKGQVEQLDKMLNTISREICAVFFFDLPESETIARLEPRRVCTKDQTHIYHLVNKPPKNDMVCDIDGAPLKHRDDDMPDAIKKRVSEYMKETLPLLDVYRGRGLVHHLDAMQSIDEVTDAVMQVASGAC
jgi:adenylate kinase